MNPLGRCCHDCSRYCLDECSCEYQCGCCKFNIQTHHTPSAQAGGDEEDFESLRFHLNQTLYIPTINSTRLYEFGIKGLTFVFPLRDGVSTIINLLEDCASVEPQLAEEMSTLAMNKIFNAPPHTRSNIDRRMFPNTENSSSNYNKYNKYSKYGHNSNAGTTTSATTPTTATSCSSKLSKAVKNC